MIQIMQRTHIIPARSSGPAKSVIHLCGLVAGAILGAQIHVGGGQRRVAGVIAQKPQIDLPVGKARTCRMP
jgi:hypothetical protein